jgi:hypothetical protein
MSGDPLSRTALPPGKELHRTHRIDGIVLIIFIYVVNTGLEYLDRYSN